VSPELRSQAWFATDNLLGRLIHRSWQKKDGTPDRMFDGRPVIGICNTWSELTPCNVHLRDLAERVRRGVLEAGGYPVEFPVMSTGESLLRPTAMLFRNLVSMDVEESIRGYPIDGVVLLCGCDKTTPALLMGAASCDLPTIVVSGGPMLNGRFRGAVMGSGRSIYELVDDVATGRRDLEDLEELEAGLSRSPGHCNSMGTASTMGALTEALGVALPHNAAVPAVDARRNVLAQDAGRRIVGMVEEDLRLSAILTRPAFENAIRVNAAIGGSTNAVIHLLALAGRVGIELSLEDFDALGADVPLLVDVMPSGRFLMEELFDAGGMPAVLRELAPLLHGEAVTVTGRTLAENNADAGCWNREVIRPLAEPLQARAGIRVLRGNLAPDGAVIKPSAASSALLRHRGRAVVFDSAEDLAARIDDPALELDETSVMVLRNVGPRGYPGMPEVGKLPLPRRLLERGVQDVVRISDARMSGTAFGTIVLHAAPEAAVGGPLALVRDGDVIELDVEAGRLHLDVAQAELEARRAAWAPPPPVLSGYQRLYADHVLQADTGADFDFLIGRRPAGVPKCGIY
jgi:L-arabonate dehydrase